MIEKLFPRAGKTGLLVIDVQQSLIGAMPDRAIAAKVIRNHQILLELSAIFALPVVYTEHYPKGLGATVAELQEPLARYPRIEKVEFSACQNTEFREKILPTLPDDIILTGIETHVCILMTALDLMHHGLRVFVPVDAVASRTMDNWSNGLDLLRQAGAIVTNTESMVFQRLQKAGGENFKRMLGVLK